MPLLLHVTYELLPKAFIALTTLCSSRHGIHWQLSILHLLTLHKSRIQIGVVDLPTEKQLCKLIYILAMYQAMHNRQASCESGTSNKLRCLRSTLGIIGAHSQRRDCTKINKEIVHASPS